MRDTRRVQERAHRGGSTGAQACPREGRTGRGRTSGANETRGTEAAKIIKAGVVKEIHRRDSQLLDRLKAAFAQAPHGLENRRRAA